MNKQLVSLGLAAALSSSAFGVVNNVPVIEPIPTQLFVEDGSKTIEFDMSDIEDEIKDLEVFIDAERGTAIINKNGKIEFIPEYNYFTSEEGIKLTLTVTDTDGGVTTQVINVMVFPVNDAPIIEPISKQYVGQNGTKTISFTADDLDGDTIVASANAIHGEAIINGNGEIEYTPKEDFLGNDVITLKVDDGNGGIATKSFNIQVE